MTRAAASAPYTTDVTFSCHISAMASGSMSIQSHIAAPTNPPALLTQTSMVPNFSTA